MARCVGVFQILVQNRCVFSEQLPEYFIRAKYLYLIRHVKVVNQVVLVNDIAKADETGLRPGLVYQEHRGQVAHSLYVANVRPKTIERTEYIFQ